MTETSDEVLMTQYCEGDHAAFTTLYHRHKGPLYRYFCRQLGLSQQSRAEELFHETWARLIEKRHTYTPTAKLTTLLYRIAHNLVIDESRKTAHADHYLESAEPEHQGMDTDIAARKSEAIRSCMALLPDKQREAFLLRHEAGLNSDDICSIVSIKAEALKTRLRYAMSQLRECLTRKLGDRQ
nr:sigma-70 family RNA polymerase sigma factor [Thaumasiovibrio subtropicus]